ncbi:phosphatidylethanolamine-binding protein [Plasmodium cynomolgi strain B]|uniref:Phosphatidylethanolamine-binding protein n=1 Tax=Plasmodium cynomolgi (strain B) TaxID=1120755 RepID=K6UMZ9_PLACD|nr:phosphatidylethanolamine-binding protein [Plasmodium cynomolgi strain B]GAB69028.1 phosphatidylethanolamine-binding protein [Plasmodium cynomolgi strain B]
MGVPPTVEELKREKIIPHVFPDENVNLTVDMFISFKSGKEVNHGNILDLAGTGSVPRNIKFSEAPPDDYCYILFMIDPDFPSRRRPDGRDYVHWAVSGIKSKELEENKSNISGVPLYRGEHYITRVKFNNCQSAYNVIQMNDMKIVGFNWCQIEA